MEDWAEIRRLHRAEGVPIKEIARRLGVARNTVRAALASDRPPQYERAPRGSVVDAFEPQIRALLAEWPRMPAPVIARADRLAVLDVAVEEAAGADPAGVRGHRPGRPGRSTSRARSRSATCGSRSRGSRSRPGQERVLPVLVMTLGFSRFMTATMIPSRQAGDILSGMWPLICRVGRVTKTLVWDRESAIGGTGRVSAPAAAFAGTLATRIQLAPPRDPEYKGMVEREQRLPGDLVPARPAVRLAGGLQRPARRAGWRGPTPARSARSRAARWTCWTTDYPSMLDAAAGRPAGRAAPPDPARPRLLRARRHRRLLRRPARRSAGSSRSPPRRDAVTRVLRRAGRRPPPPVLGQARRDHRPRPHGHRRDAMRQALADDRRATPGSHPPPRRRAPRRAAGPAGLRRPVRRRLRPNPHTKASNE